MGPGCMNPPWRFFVFLALLCAAIPRVQAGTFEEYKKHIVDTNSQCISEANAKLVIGRLFKDFPPSKEILLSFERSTEYKLKASLLKAFQPYLKASPEQQFAWMEKFLKENGKYYDHPATKPWTIEYQSAYFMRDGELDAHMYKKFPKKKGVCITGIILNSPRIACFDNQRLGIGFDFESGGRNNSALLRAINLSPLRCDL